VNQLHSARPDILGSNTQKSTFFNLSKPPTTQNIAEMKDVGTDEKQKIRLVSFNCKNIKTCALIIDKLLQEVAVA
jgi:hypothetical protein